jgi:hypothetical protein
MSVDPGYADYLKSESLTAVAAVAGAEAKWGDRAVTSSIMTPLVDLTATNVEAAAQADFLAGPCARDTIVVRGKLASLFLRPVTIKGDRLGYESSPVVFVLAATENPNGTTTLTVLKRLP